MPFTRRDAELIEAAPTLITALLKERTELDGLLREWAATRANTRGTYVNNHPIHGDGRNAASTETPWGCNTCGIGWPCLVTRSIAALDAKEHDTKGDING